MSVKANDLDLYSHRESDYTFTVFIPTYNRAHTLDRAMKSLESQTFKDFEVVVIDDGSQDGTRELIESWQRKANFPIRYYWQENQGKHMAHNHGLEQAKGFFFVTLDSDDMLAPTALERLKFHWDGIPEEKKEEFAGVEGLCAFQDGQIAGTPFPEGLWKSNYLEMRKIHGVKGDKKNAIRTSVLRRFPYPRFEGERHVRPSLILKRMALEYKFKYVNDVIQIIEYQPDGLSSNRFRLRVKNPKGFRLYILEEIKFHSSGTRYLDLFRYYAKFVRYSLHSGVGFLQQAREVKSRTLWLLSLPRGIFSWIWDRIKMALKMA